MSFNPVITTEDVRLALNGTYSAVTQEYTFWGQNLSSGSVLAQVNMANIYLHNILGDSTINSTDTSTMYHVRACELDYSAMRVITLLSGDVIVDGFNWAAGVSVQQPNLLATFRMLVAEFKESAQLHLRAVQPLFVTAESDSGGYRDTAPSYF